MKFRKETIVSTIIVFLFVAITGYYIFWPMWLTAQYGEEVRIIMQDIQLRLKNINADNVSEYYTVLDETLVDASIENALRCPECSIDRQVVPKVNVLDVYVKQYTQNRIRFYARIETAILSYDRETGEPTVPCYGLARRGEYILVKIDGVWKISKSPWVEVDNSLPVQTVRESVCP